MRTLKPLALAAALVPSLALAAEGDWLIRGRVIDIAPTSGTSDALSALDVEVEDRVVPELDFTYFLTRNIAAELILATAKHDVDSDIGKLGTVKHLPPTLSFQYHFAPDATVRPYLGLGLNYTRFYGVDLAAGANDVELEKSSFGWAAQAGMDIALNKTWFLNVDVKKIAIATDVELDNGAELGTLDIDPYIFGVGFGTRF
ncbi:MAG: OmpW family protein [Gammaproteobacteria bacterium]|nr:OmpW family protein [Gammaproteobacteria bacterium]